MTTTTLSETIHAPIGLVFETVADITKYREAIAHIVGVEMLSEVQRGVGTRFRETRRMPNGKEMSNELEVTELVDDDHVRIVCDTHGTVWDTTFTVRDLGAGRTELALVMHARAHKLVARLINPLIKGMVAKEVAKDLQAVKAHCERLQGPAGATAPT